MDISKTLCSIDLLAVLPAASLDTLITFSSLRTIRRGETIFCQGEPSPYCFGVVSGEVTIRYVSRDPKDAARELGILPAGTMFGESALFENTARAAMASASQNGQLVAIQGPKLREWIFQNPILGSKFLLGMLQQVHQRLEQNLTPRS